MHTLANLKDTRIFLELNHVADLVEVSGISTTAPLSPRGSISLPYGLAIICGMKHYPACDDFSFLIDQIPQSYVSRFIMCWDAIEMEVEEDIVEWSERVGTKAVVTKIRSLASEIQHS
jgi:hypothetical protein